MFHMYYKLFKALNDKLEESDDSFEMLFIRNAMSELFDSWSSYAMTCSYALTEKEKSAMRWAKRVIDRQ